MTGPTDLLMTATTQLSGRGAPPAAQAGRRMGRLPRHWASPPGPMGPGGPGGALRREATARRGSKKGTWYDGAQGHGGGHELAVDARGLRYRPPLSGAAQVIPPSTSSHPPPSHLPAARSRRGHQKRPIPPRAAPLQHSISTLVVDETHKCVALQTSSSHALGPIWPR